MKLDPVQIRTVLQGLPGWQVEDGALVRGFPVVGDSRGAFIEAIANVRSDSAVQPEVHLQPDLVVVRVGDPSGRLRRPGRIPPNPGRFTKAGASSSGGALGAGRLSRIARRVRA